MIYGGLIVASWLVLIAVWFAMARRVKTVAQHESAFSTLSHYGPLAVGIFLLAAPRVPLFPLDVRFVPLALWPVQLGAALTVAGVAFAIWARALLAGNWSSSVTVKRDHELIVEGPYRIVRHPIYTGILTRPDRDGARGRRMARRCSAWPLQPPHTGASSGSRRAAMRRSSARPTPATPSTSRRSFLSCSEGRWRQLATARSRAAATHLLRLPPARLAALAKARCSTGSTRTTNCPE